VHRLGGAYAHITSQNFSYLSLTAYARRFWTSLPNYHRPPQTTADQYFLTADQFLANVNSLSRSLYVVVCPSVCLSSVCNVRAPYSGDWNFWQCFYAIQYVGHLTTSR